MKKHIARHRQKIAYLVVGTWNTLFGYGVFAALYYFFHDALHYTAILTISFVAGVTNSYIGYKLAVFQTKGNVLVEYLRFYLVYSVSFVVNLMSLPFLIEVMNINIYLAQAGILFLTVVASYVLHKKFSFKEKAE